MVQIVVADSLYDIEPVTTQTEVKPGWKIVDYQLPDKALRYLWGKHSRQPIEGGTPTFIIHPVDCKLFDFVVLKLKEKKQYRRFPSVNIYKCEINRIDLDFAKIELIGEEHFRVTPIKPLLPGEYILLNTSAKPVNGLGDVEVYPFTITK